LELADEAKADYLVSGDKLVLSIKKYKNTKIISPSEFFDQL
jgi:predicted nucleic acid-binding protein